MPQLEGYSVRVIVAPDHVSRSPSSCPSWTILLFFLTLKVYSFVQRQKCQKLWMEACQGKMANCCWVGKGWGGGGGEMTLHVLAYYPRGSKNKRKIGGFSSSTSGKIGLLVCSLTWPKCITSGQTGSPYTGFQIWHECNFKFLDKFSLCWLSN